MLRGRLVRSVFTSGCLAGNRLGDPAQRSVLVYLPPEYDGARRFPVVVLLPGFASTHESMLAAGPWEQSVVDRFDRLIAERRSAPAILALPDCMTRWGGSQFLDSPATGRYQTYLVEEVLAHLDETFRTIPEAAGRAVAGRSSGGFGALRLVMDRPGYFGAVASHAGDAAFEVSMRPMLTTAAIALDRAGGLEAFAARLPDGGPATSAEFDAAFVLAASCAYAPEPDAPPPHCALPFDPRTAALRADVWERWLAHDPLVRVPDHAGALAALALIFLDAGSRDEHGLCFAARQLADAMTGAGVPVTFEEFEGGHRGTSFRYERSLPLLVAALEGRPA
ncbi:MAG: alpha/beta hydrolase [Myxococcales bacterium]|nr:alpha/beta hydrolase [Myxococcales bacterium]